jgi:tetratricopeptide (TPR) repeat protein
MTRSTDVGALAAWAAPPPGPENGDRGSAVSAVKPTPFRSAAFDDVHGAVERGRYRLAPALVHWSDVAAFEERLDTPAGPEGRERITALENARDLYRGDLFDDCPFYGDSAYVEERREYLRGRFGDLLVELGDRYAELGDVATAAARYRQALSVNPDEARARAGLERMGGVGAAGAI